MNERFEVGQRVFAEDTEREGVIRIVEPGVNVYWYIVEFDDVTLRYPYNLLRAVPTDPPAPRGDRPTSADDARIAEIREWTTSVWAQDEFVYVAEDIRFLLARLDDFTKWKESADTVLLDHAALLHDDLKDFGSPAQNLREVVMGIVARLDVVTKERDQLRQRNDYLRARLNVYLQESTDG